MTLTSTSALVSARDRCVPVDEALAPLLPDAGLMRGRVVGCTGPAAMTLALALTARATTTGAWLAVVGVPMLGVEAAAELGVPLERLVRVDTDGRPATWAERVGAAADGFDLILTRPPAGADRVVRKVRQRLQARGVVMLAVGPTSPGISCDLEFTTTAIDWAGVGDGWGSLYGRRAVVRAGGRRQPRAVERELWLPGPNGRVRSAEPVDAANAPMHDRVGDLVSADGAIVELSRAG